MCQFKSAIVLKEPRNKGGFQLLMSPWTERHSDLIQMYNLKDDGRLKFARIEFCPPSLKTAHLVETYKLRIDEERCPDWFDEEMKSAVGEKMTAYIKSIIVSGDVNLLIGGQFIIAPNVKVQSTKACIINAMIDSNVGEMWESSNVGEMWGSSNVGVMRESSNVGVMRESSNVGVMRGSSNVGEMWESSNVGVMWGSSKVNKDFRKK